MFKIIFILFILFLPALQAATHFLEAERTITTRFLQGDYEFVETHCNAHYPSVATISADDTLAQRMQLIKLGMLEFGEFGPAHEDEKSDFAKNVKAHLQHLQAAPFSTSTFSFLSILEALWNINIFSEEFIFPGVYKELFPGAPSPQKGLRLLKNLEAQGDINATYLLYLYYSKKGEGREAHEYLRRASRLGHHTARSIMEKTGDESWKDRYDQFGDHCTFWVCFPNIERWTDLLSFGRFLGFGKAEDGWVQCNCCLFGCASELNCAAIANHSSNDMRSFLLAADFPIRASAALAAMGTTALQAAGLGPYALALGITATCCSTCAALVQQEYKNPDNKDGVSQQPNE